MKKKTLMKNLALFGCVATYLLGMMCSDKIDEYEREEDKAELKEELLEELRSERGD